MHFHSRVALFFLPFAIILAQPLAPPNDEIICKAVDDYRLEMRALARPVTNDAMFDYDVSSYNLYFDIDPENEDLRGQTRINLTAQVAGLNTIMLDLSAVLSVDSVYLDAASFSQTGSLLTVMLTDSINAGESATIGIAYHGRPQEDVGFQGFAFDYHNGQRIISTLSEPYGAHTWWPCKDSPRDKADSLTVTVRVPDGLVVVSNGLLVDTLNNHDGTTTWFWEHHYPIATYLVHLAITNYSFWQDMYYFADGDSMKLQYWVYPETYSAYYTYWHSQTAYMLDAYNTLFGKYPFANEKYGMVQFNWGGGMEHQTGSSMGGNGEYLNAHEMAHQWWGDMITCADFHHIWLNEGFAAYSEALYAEQHYGTAAYFSKMASKDNDFGGSIFRVDTSSVGSIFYRIVYDKAAWVLHMLRHVVGDSNFFDILHQYREEFQYATVKTSDFQGVCETVYGSSLEWFFDEWIYGSGRPSYQWWYETRSTDGVTSQTTLHVEQVQATSYPTYAMPIDFHFATSTRDTVVRVWNDSRSMQTDVDLPFIPTTIQFDPDKWVYRRVQQVVSIGPEIGGLPQDFLLYPAFPNPFNGQVTFPITVTRRQVIAIRIFNSLGQQVYSDEVILDGFGRYRWNGRDDSGQAVESGVYLVSVSSANQTEHLKISYIK